MPDEPIGSVRVDVVADYSKLAQGMKEAEGQASQAGAKIASAFTSAVAPAASLTEATNRLKAAQAALTSEGAKMLAQVQATAPGYQAAQAAIAEMNSELGAAQASYAATAAAAQAAASATTSTAAAAGSAAAAQQALAVSTQAAAAAAQTQAAAATTNTAALTATAAAATAAANANNQIPPSQNNATGSAIRWLAVLGLLKRALGELDEVRKSEMELYHLSEATGISAQKFAEFQGAIGRAGGDSDTFAKSIVFLTRSIEQGERGVKTMSDELKRLGVTSKDPIEAFYQIADTLHNTRDKSEALAAASRVLGRGEQELIGIMGEGSAALREYAAQSQGLASARVAGQSSAAELTRVEAELGAVLKESEITILPAVTLAVRVLATVFAVSAQVIGTAINDITYSMMALWDAAKGTAAVASQALQGNWSGAAAAARSSFSDIRSDFGKMNEEVRSDAEKTKKFIDTIWGSGPKVEPGKKDPFPKPAQKVDKGPETELRHQYQEELADLKADHELTIQEEIDFWQTRYAVVQAKGAAFADLSREIHRSIGTLNQRLFKEQDAEIRKGSAEYARQIETAIKQAQDAAAESGGHPAAVKLKLLVESEATSTGAVAERFRSQIPDAQKAADKEATADLKKLLGEQDQAWEESGIRTATEVKRRAEIARSALEELRPFFVGIDALIDAETAKIINANKRIEAEKLKVADLVAKNQESGGQAEVTSRKIALESAYGLQVVHTYQEQVAYQQQMSALEAESLQLKLARADADYTAAAASRDDVRIQQALNEQAAAGAAIDLQRERSAAELAKLKQQTSFGGQVEAGLAQDAQGAVTKLSSGIANLATQTKGWGREFKNILKEIEKSLIETFATSALKQGLNGLEGLIKNRTGGGGGVLGTAVGATAGAVKTATGAATGTAQAAATTALTAAETANTAALAASTAADVTVAAGLTAMLAGITAQSVGTAANTVAVAALTAAVIELTAIDAVNAILPFAAGGDPPVGIPSLVGERGPELFIPKGAGTIIPADKTKAMLAQMQQGLSGLRVPPGALDASAAPASAFFSDSQTQNVSSSTASAVTNHNVGGSVGTMHFHVNGAESPRETTRAIADFMKRQTGKYSPANS